MKRAANLVAHRAWRLLPTEFRRTAMAGMAAQFVRRPSHSPPSVSHGAIVAGDMAGANGLAENARLIHAILASHGLSRGFVPLGLPSVVPAVAAEVEAALPDDAALLAAVNAPILPVGLLRYPRNFIRNRLVIGLWAWELPVVPKHWQYGARFVHEVWVPSTFSAEALEHLAPGRVRVMLHPLGALPLAVTGDRAGFALPEDRLVVLTVFNLSSSMERKNPLGSIAAFKAAFGARDDVLFVLKLSGVEDYPADLRTIRAAIGDAPNIRLIADTLPAAALRGLIAASDIVMSLHRAEGFGLIPATAMLLGRPVVATGWSGNLDFMTPECSALVSYRLVPVVDPRGTYQLPNAMWAEPALEDCVAWLRRLADDSGLRGRMAAAGQAHAREKLGEAPLLAALAANGIVC
jgi:glycosyltransferase involved in cell wall biosynthesis